jgi:hypothetical protein
MTLYTQTNHLKSEIERLALATSWRIKIHYYSKPEEITGLISIEEAETTHADSPKPVVWAIRGGERERFPPESFTRWISSLDYSCAKENPRHSVDLGMSLEERRHRGEHFQ